MIPVRHSAPSVDDGEQIAFLGINPPAAWFATPGSRQVGYSEAMPERELKAESAWPNQEAAKAWAELLST